VDVFASLDQPVSIFISDDLPTFDLPINPNSGFVGAGHSFNVGLLLIKVAERIIIKNLIN
jgi:hypothetical protein